MNNCNHEYTKMELLPPNQEHCAGVVCTNPDCGKTLCYQAHPHILAKRQQNAADIQKLLADSQLTAFERGFLTGVRNHKPTPAQQQILDALVSKYILKRSDSNEQGREAAPVTAG